MVDFGEAEGDVAVGWGVRFLEEEEDFGEGRGWGWGLHLVVAGCAADAAHFLGVDGEGVLAVLLQHREGLLVGDLPHPVRVAGHPLNPSLAEIRSSTVEMMLLTDFREGNELASGLAGFVDEVDGLLDTALEIEPCWLGGDGGGLVLGENHFQSEYRVVFW